MERIGVRELRRDASRWLARVRGGESFVITDRGRPVASLAPLPAETGYAALVAAGRIVPGTGEDLGTVIDRINAKYGPPPKGSLSQALADLREDER